MKAVWPPHSAVRAEVHPRKCRSIGIAVLEYRSEGSARCEPISCHSSGQLARAQRSLASAEPERNFHKSTRRRQRLPHIDCRQLDWYLSSPQSVALSRRLGPRPRSVLANSPFPRCIVCTAPVEYRRPRAAGRLRSSKSVHHQSDAARTHSRCSRRPPSRPRRQGRANANAHSFV